MMYYFLIFIKDTLSTVFWLMEINYDVWIYNHIPDTYSSITPIGVWSSSRFDSVS